MKVYNEESEHVDDDCVFTNEDFKDLAKTYLSMFFKHKASEDGFAIEAEDLLTDRNVSLVLNLNIAQGMDVIYNGLKQCFVKEKRKGKVPGDVELVLALLSECSKMSIPKCFAAGLIAVYIELCKGCKIEV